MIQPLLQRIGTLRTQVGRLEAEWRRQRLPPPTRDAPRPDPDALRVARRLEESGRLLDLIGGQLRSQPARAADGEADAALLAHADFLLALTEPGIIPDADQLLASLDHLRDLTLRRASQVA